MKTVLLLLTSDRFSSPLIRYLVAEGKRYGWKTSVASMGDPAFLDRIRQEEENADVNFLTIADAKQCDQAVKKSHLVIAMIPDVMLLPVADSCIAHKKTLVAPSRLSRQLFSRKAQAKENGALLLVECGFNPGLDHITAKKMIDNIHAKGGKISSFKTYSGSVIAEDSVDNPWNYKLTEPVLDVVNAGRGNNRHLMRGQLQHVSHHQLFSRAESVEIAGLKNMVVIPEDDALYSRKVYELSDAHTVVKGRLIRKGFDSVWDLLIRLGLTNNTCKIDLFEDKSFHNFIRSVLPYSASESTERNLERNFNATHEDIEKLKWLGLLEEQWLEGYKEITPAIILQHLMEFKLSMLPHDKDCVIMRHELEYAWQNYQHRIVATLVTQGEDERNSAMAKAIAMTLGASAKAVLLGNIKLKGIHTPICKEIYDPILNELEDLGVAFHVEETKVHESEQVPVN
jgi:saccharopine dehydrogenase-like NADP-dependent oxidoreductase